MNLKSIKLAGFKSFADPTTLLLSSTLTAIVGPNGCGKSNIVDALRCVIGESSAKQLRGEQLTDIIFNGSANRKPLKRAVIELHFDNAQKCFGEAYAHCADIVVRREIRQDSHSHFYLNNIRCRRRDITDLFLGTGLGSATYAIIEQGIISKLIEGKPEALRIYLEEAAGISKYRERRQEANNRLSHTRENLVRLADIRAELEKQVTHLKRQANAAERFNLLKQEQRLLKAQLHALQCQVLLQQQTVQKTRLRQHAIDLETQNSTHQDCLQIIEQHRLTQIKTQEIFNQLQDKYHMVGSDVVRHEQQIQHSQMQIQQWHSDLEQLHKNTETANQQLQSDQAKQVFLQSELINLNQEMQGLNEATTQSMQVLKEITKKKTEIQTQWEQAQLQMSQIQHKTAVTQTHIAHIQQKIHGLTEHALQLAERLSLLNTQDLTAQITLLVQQAAGLTQQSNTLELQLQSIKHTLQTQQKNNQLLQITRDQLQKDLHQLQNQQASLAALQQMACKHDLPTLEWLTKKNWLNKPRLLADLSVEPGWEIAVETVLESHIDAICIQDYPDFQTFLEEFKIGNLTLLYTAMGSSAAFTTACIRNGIKLRDKIQTKGPLPSLIDSVYVVQDNRQARALIPHLAPYESVVTQQGWWFGKNWLRVHHTFKEETDSILKRKKILAKIEADIQICESKKQVQISHYQQGQAAIETLEEKWHQQQAVLADLLGHHNEVKVSLGAQRARLEQQNRQEATIYQDQEKLKQQQIVAQAELQAAKIEQFQQLAEKKISEESYAALCAQKQAIAQNYQQSDQLAQADQQKLNAAKVRLANTNQQLYYSHQNIERMQTQITQLKTQQEALIVRQTNIQSPLMALETDLKELLTAQGTIQTELTSLKQQLLSISTQLNSHEQHRLKIEKIIQQIRESLEKDRLIEITIQTQYEHHLSQLIAAGYTHELLKTVPTEATQAVWQKQIEQIGKRIQQLGAINLAAIEEFNTLSERKQYLDKQYNDLVEALQMLEQTIFKMDNESQMRLKTIFDTVNMHFKTLFIRMFEGGNAELEWIGEEILTAGILIRAQPPGKRNTLLHVLSGGEKALTAIALVFALFQLNPAPFCVLDEVDAPLDEANVGRFCRLLKAMSDSVQFLFISHNKATLAVAEQIIGVTMPEPGVSRLVSVDMQQAIGMAET